MTLITLIFGVRRCCAAFFCPRNTRIDANEDSETLASAVARRKEGNFKKGLGESFQNIRVVSCDSSALQSLRRKTRFPSYSSADPICSVGQLPLRFGQREFSRNQDCHRTALV